MANVIDHYENHLADHYSWIFGGTESDTKKNKLFFESHSILPVGVGTAVDLGCGTGFQSIPLFLGYERNGMGWDLKKSFYRKTRVPLDWAKEELEKEGFAVEFSNSDKGLITIIARR